MPLDTSKVVWDTPAASKIDASKVQWDEGDKGPSWGDAAMSAPGAALGEIVGGIKGAGEFIASLPHDPLGAKLWRGAKALPGALAHEAGGALQYFRDMSPKEFRGSAPTFEGGEPEKHPWLGMLAGDTAPMRQNVAERPLALLADVAGVAGATAPGRAALGAIADASMAGPRKLGRVIADMTPANRAENKLLEASRNGSDTDTIAALLSGNRSPVPEVPYSAAQAAQAPGITALERGSRINPQTAPAWANFDAMQNTGLGNAMQRVVGGADDAAVESARAARDAATSHTRSAALALADQGGFDGLSTAARPGLFEQPIQHAVGSELAGPRGALPSVNTTANYVLNGESTATAGRAYETRKMLSDALNAKAGVPLDEIASAAKSGGVSTRAIRNSIDTALDRASGGMWREYLDSFAANSKDVNSVQALNNIRAELEKKIEGGALDGNGNPKLSRAYLNQIIQRHATNKYGDVILPAAKGQLDDIVTTAQRMEAPQLNYKNAVSGGGGTTTAHDVGLGVAKHVGGTGARTIISLVQALGGIGEGAGATRLAELLQSPVDASQALRTAAEREAARKAKKSSGVKPAALAAALAAQN